MDIEKAAERITINSIYGVHGLDPESMYPMSRKEDCNNEKHDN
jgi:hypothetical protein